MKRVNYRVLTMRIIVATSVIFLGVAIWGIGKEHQQITELEERAHRADMYCLKVRYSFQSSRELLDGHAGRQAQAEHLRAVIEMRLGYDDIMQCTPKVFDLKRFDACVARDDFACAKAVIDQHLAAFTVEPR